MKGSSKLSQASFRCKHCNKAIFIPAGLAATTAPCPHCGKEVTSPDQSMKPVPGGSDAGAGAGQADTAAAPAAKPAPVTETIRLEAPKKSVAEAAQNEDLGMPRLAGGGGGGNKRRGKGNMAAVIAAVLILLVAGGVTLWLAGKWEKDQQADAGGADRSADTPTMSAEAWSLTGWKQDASEVLSAFMTAKTPEERMKYAIPNEGVLDELKMFYPAGSDDADTPQESFGHVMGGEADRRRGIFLMQYRQPAQIDMRGYFAPIGSLEAVTGQRLTSLLEMAHRIDEGNLSSPIGINAFFKKTDQGLKLDASVFIQGKFRTFRAFVDYPRPGKTQVFRVVARESLSHELRDDLRYRTYRLEDFAYPRDFVNVPIRVDSEAGKILAALNWRGLNRELTMRTATVELGWSDESPSQLKVIKVVCWEFLGVGGAIGNTVVQESPADSSAGGE